MLLTVMGGCTNCASKGGCSTRKGEERALLGRLLPELYPSARWGEIDDRRRDGIPEREGRRLARQAAELLKAPTRFRAGAADELCDWIWVLCVGREPPLIDAWDDETGGPLAAHIDLLDVHEVYLRVALSTLARVATVQEVSLTLAQDGPGWSLSQAPSPGIYSPVLLPRTQKLVELIVAADISFLDFGLIESAPPGFDRGQYAAAAEAPSTVGYLFYPQPPRAVSTQWLPATFAPKPVP